MKILYLSKNIKNYKGANYQKEFIHAISKFSKLIIYGPGQTNFDKTKSINQFLKQKGPFDLIFVGHSWLSDSINSEIDPWKEANLKNIKVKKYIFLNKEYVNLKKKLSWIKQNKFELVFSHHQDCKKWENSANSKFKFIPFAYDKNFFYNLNKKRRFDIAFSGVLQNSHGDKVQSDLRVKIMNFFFHTLFEIPIIKRKKFKNLNIYWNSIPRSLLGRIISKIFGFYSFLDKKEYAKIQRETKIYINCKSPLNLISPRYFENIASGCLILTEKNKDLKKLLPVNSYYEFSNNLSDFEENIIKLLKNYKYYRKLSLKNSNYFKNRNSWNERAKLVLKSIRKN